MSKEIKTFLIGIGIVFAIGAVLVLGMAIGSGTNSENQQSDSSSYEDTSTEGTESAESSTSSDSETDSNQATEADEPAPNWQKVASIEGNADKKSDTFELTGGKVKAIYQAKGNEYNDAYFNLKGIDDTSEDIAQTSGTMSDETFLYPEAGEYYLEVNVANNTKYELELLELK